MMQPAIVARDPGEEIWNEHFQKQFEMNNFKCFADLIKRILINEFDSFRYNDFRLSKIHDPLLSTNPFFTNDDEWKESRKTILPAFSQTKV